MSIFYEIIFCLGKAIVTKELSTKNELAIRIRTRKPLWANMFQGGFSGNLSSNTFIKHGGIKSKRKKPKMIFKIKLNWL